MTADEWKRIGVLVLLCFLNIVFWGIYEQQGNTLQLWADDRTNWTFFGLTLPSSWYQSFNPAFIFIFAPILSAFWAWQSSRKSEPSSVTKMGLGCVICGGAYLIMIAAAVLIPENEKGSLFWLTSTTWLFTMGELYLSPIGLSLVTKVAPRRMVSMMMGVWYLSSFFGNYAAGFFGSFYSVMAKTQFFGFLAVAGVATGVLFFVVRGPVARVIGRST